MQEHQILEIPAIHLNWSEWTPWSAVARNFRDGGANLPDTPGVYEVKHKAEDERITIGRTKHLRGRVKEALVKGSGPHSTGERIEKARIAGHIRVDGLVIRWAETNRPAAAEEELHRRYIEDYGGLPKQTMNT